MATTVVAARHVPAASRSASDRFTAPNAIVSANYANTVERCSQTRAVEASKHLRQLAGQTHPVGGAA